MSHSNTRDSDEAETSKLLDGGQHCSVSIDGSIDDSVINIDNTAVNESSGDSNAEVEDLLLPNPSTTADQDGDSCLVSDPHAQGPDSSHTCVEMNMDGPGQGVPNFVPPVLVWPYTNFTERIPVTRADHRKESTNRTEAKTPNNLSAISSLREQKKKIDTKKRKAACQEILNGGHTDAQKVKDAGTETSNGASRVKDPSVSSPIGRQVLFMVGEGKQAMTGLDSQLAVISPVFDAMFAERWKPGKQQCESPMVVEIPDVDVNTFAVILRCSLGQDLQLTKDSVWPVLAAADRYQVTSVVNRCFHHLLHLHPFRHRSRHLCAVTETAHRLHYTRHHHECLALLKQHACRVLRNGPALSELCQQCMLALITADDLAVPGEMWIHDAVVTWALQACGETEPSLETLRATAGPLLYQVRYLTIPHRTLKNLTKKSGRVSSLLTSKELCGLLDGDAVGFPETVMVERRMERKRVSLCGAQNKAESACTIAFVIALFLLFLFAVVCVPIMYAVRNL